MKTLIASQIKEMHEQDADFLLVNTLDEKHFAETRIPGSINIPQSKDDFANRVEQAAGGKDKTVVVYCASTECDSSVKAAEKLEQAGFQKVFDFEAGAEGWKDAGEKLAAV